MWMQPENFELENLSANCELITDIAGILLNGGSTSYFV
jgi:hypothetical protein